MIHNYQEQKRMEIMEPQEASFATVGTVYSDGLTLIFDGGTESVKRYKCNISAVFSAGNRVRVRKDSGTYVVEYPVGNPRTSITADFIKDNSGGNAIQFRYSSGNLQWRRGTAGSWITLQNV